MAPVRGLVVIVLAAAAAGAAAGRAPEQFTVEFVTTVNGGSSFFVELRRENAPNGVDRFFDLVQRHFYDHNAFFRVVPGFVVQWGLSGNPALNAEWANANIKDDPVTLSNTAGTLTFATAGPDTRTTQLFVNLGDNSRLDSMGFSPIGRVVRGLEVVSSVFAGYGEAPDQGSITAQGDSYLQNFPRLDYIKTVRLASGAPSGATASVAAAELPDNAAGNLFMPYL